jgi:hypothetical protein
MLSRLLIGLLKGIVVGGLLGFALAKLGFAVPGALVAYLGVAVVGMVVACVAGKPIWARGSRIEVGMKAAAGGLLAPALLYAVRRWITPGLPLDPASLGLDAAGATLGTFAVSSYAMVAAVLAGFFDADNDPADEEQQTAPKTKAPKARIASAASEPLAEAEEASDAASAKLRK